MRNALEQSTIAKRINQYSVINSQFSLRSSSRIIRLDASLFLRRGGLDEPRHSMTVVDLPPLQFVQQRFVADIQASGRLFAVPGCFFENAQDQLSLRLFGGSRSD